jgi:hypothetical protein
MLFGVTDIGQAVESLREVVEVFLNEIKDVTEASSDRRKFPRIDAQGALATLRVPGHAALQTEIADISLGGVALRSAAPVEAGMPVTIDLPDAGSPVTGNVVRFENDTLSIKFSDDLQTRSRVAAAFEARQAALVHEDGRLCMDVA